MLNTMQDILFSDVAQRFKQRSRENLYAEHPDIWAEDHNLFLWSKQREVAQSVVKNPKTLVITSNGVGKTYLSAVLVNWWLDTHNLHSTTVVTTATNWKQVANVLWKEIPRVKRIAGLAGRVTGDARWVVEGRQDPVAYGMKPADKDETGFQGVHDEAVLVIIDEAGGVSKEIFTSADKITTNEVARTLAIANPNDPSSYMAEVYEREIKLPPEKRTWHIIQFGSLDSPNFTGEPVPEDVRSKLVQVKWVEARKREWGEDDPRYVAGVLGQFPELSDDGLFNLGRVLKGMNEWEEDEYDTDAPLHIGVDVARYGSDQSVIAAYQDGHVTILGKYQNRSGPELARIVAEYAKDLGATSVRIDGIGVGASVVDHIGAWLPPHVEVLEIKGNAASPNSVKWYNWRAAMYDQFARDVANGHILLPPDDDLYSEIRKIRYEYRGSALLIESKENMRKRGVSSPDILDAVIYASQNIAALLKEEDDMSEQYVVLDDLLDEEFFTDEWGNEPWSIFPA